LWSLIQMAEFLDEKLPLDKVDLIEKIHAAYLETPDTKEVVPSLFLGEVGILLIQYKIDPSAKIEERLYNLIQDNIENPTLEALWGAPGTMIGASYMYEWSKDIKWADLFIENSNFLIKTLKESIAQGEKVWTQDMYGREVKYIGAGHGYYGNIFGILKKLELLSQEDQAFMIDHVLKTTKDMALTQDNLTNWPPTAAIESLKMPLVQWCHGSPGIITSLESFPKNIDPEFEKLLVGAGELVWHAGPLKKGVGLCHGTDGNGLAFLQLFERTEDKKWLERARKFAMHAMDQRNGRYTLFTGELGLAMYLMGCINEEGKFPVLDYI
jgi:lantibiotic modifying enzyme